MPRYSLRERTGNMPGTGSLVWAQLAPDSPQWPAVIESVEASAAEGARTLVRLRFLGTHEHRTSVVALESLHMYADKPNWREPSQDAFTSRLKRRQFGEAIAEANQHAKRSKRPSQDSKAKGEPAGEEHAPMTTCEPSPRRRRQHVPSPPSDVEPEEPADPEPIKEVDYESLPMALARPLPPGWPTPCLPAGTLLPVALPPLDPASLMQLAAADAQREEVPAGLLVAANSRRTGCKCGKQDAAKFMLACDGCDRWFHGACVGVREDDEVVVGGDVPWHCRSCVRRREAEAFRRRRYCVCRGTWDGRSFMIACDSCGAWYHGACVGIAHRTLDDATSAAFKKYVCPGCSAPTHLHVPAAVRVAEHDMARAAHEAAFSPQRSTSDRSIGSSSSSSSTALVSSPSTVARASPQLASPRARWQWDDEAASAAEDGAAAAVGADDADRGVAVIGGSGGGCGGVGSSRSGPVGSSSGGPALLSALSEDCVAHVLQQLPLTSVLLCAVPVCHALAALAEARFREASVAHGWRLPRRGSDHIYRWRRLLRARACSVCLGPDAHFPVRKQGAGGCAFRLCKPCAKRDKVQLQLRLHRLEVDTIGEHGKPLFQRQFHTPLFGATAGFGREDKGKDGV